MELLEYLPIDPDFYDVIRNEREKQIVSVINYFVDENSLESAMGTIKSIIINEKREEFLHLDSGEDVRLDRIITLNGKPGPAFDEYDSYALACLDCKGGMD